MPHLVDFHCHLDLYPDPVAAIAEAEGAGVYSLTVTTTPRAWKRNRELTNHARYVRPALGLHPQLVETNGAEIAIWEKHLEETRYIGEVGLDAGPRFYPSFALQQQVFTRVLQRCADVGGKILTVHSVRAAKAVLDLIEAHLPAAKGKVVLHWFTGSASEARRAADLGCYFSVNQEMVTQDRGRELIGKLPTDRLLTETDGPFTKSHNRPSRPTDIADWIGNLAKIKSLTRDETIDSIEANLRMLTGPGGF